MKLYIGCLSAKKTTEIEKEVSGFSYTLENVAIHHAPVIFTAHDDDRALTHAQELCLNLFPLLEGWHNYVINIKWVAKEDILLSIAQLTA